MIKHIFLTIAFLLFTNNALGCSWYVLPIAGFDTAQYIFIGEVVEIIEIVRCESCGISDIADEFVGLKIKVSENVYSPKPATYFEVFPLRLIPSCDLISYPDEVRERFPIGSQVRVVAKEATVFKNQPAGGSTIRLETSVFNRGSIARNDLSESLRTSAKSFYDYSSFFEKQQTAAKDEGLFNSYYHLPKFELQKDLLRLKETKFEDERTKILGRLVFYPHVREMSFPDIARTYLKNQNKLAALQKQWEQRVQEIYSKKQ